MNQLETYINSFRMHLDQTIRGRLGLLEQQITRNLVLGDPVDDLRTEYRWLLGLADTIHYDYPNRTEAVLGLNQQWPSSFDPLPPWLADPDQFESVNPVGEKIVISLSG
jgi:hypothetical protein